MGVVGKKIAVLPLGAYEFHGPHLPFETDTLIATAFAQRLLSALPSGMDVVLLPTEAIGYSVEHERNPQTKTLEFDTAVKRWIEIGCNCYAQGIGKFVMLNAHGGNSPLMTIVTTELRRQFPMLAVATGWTRFLLPQEFIPAAEKELDIHGGLLETSLMLTIAPERVNMAHAINFHNKQADYINQFDYLRAYGRHTFGWMMDDINPQGAAGNAAAASAALGEKILTHVTGGLVALLRDVDHFNLEQLPKNVPRFSGLKIAVETKSRSMGEIQ